MLANSTTLAWHSLLTPAGRELLNIAQTAHGQGLESADINKLLRTKTADAELVAACLTQLDLRAKAIKKFGKLATQLLFTPAALEQASRAPVAALHAAKLKNAGIKKVFDLGCGIGAESLAFLQAGLEVIAYEIDELTAAFAAHNLLLVYTQLRDPQTNYSARPPQVLHRDAHSALPELHASHAQTPTAAFFDPARRDIGHRNTKRINPKDYLPNLDFIFNVGTQMPALVKLGPGFDREMLPAAADATWVSVNGEAVETLLSFQLSPCTNPKTSAAAREALLINTRLNNVTQHSLSSAEDTEKVAPSPLGKYIYEPDPAVIRARQIGQLAVQLNAGVISENIAYLTGNTLLATPFAQSFEVLEVLPLRAQTIAKRLAQLQITAVEIKKRGVEIDPALFRKKLKLKKAKHSKSATLILTRVAGSHCALLCQRITPAPQLP